MLKFIHLTDTHFVPPGETLYGTDPVDGLAAAVESIGREHGDAAFCIVTGDLTHRGHPAAFAALRKVLDGLTMPVHLLIGNHDDRERFSVAFPGAPRDANGFVQAVVPTSQGIAVMLDTNEPGISAGVFCEKRAAWLADTLADDPDSPVLLFMHHPPFPIGIPSMDRVALVDSGMFREALEPHRGRVRHLFFGHVHRPIAGSWRGVPFSTLRGTNHQVALELRDTPRIRGSQEPHQYGVVLVGDEQVVVHFHDYEDRSARFDL